MNRLTAIFLSLLLLANAGGVKFSQAQLDKIADKCGLPRSAMQLHGKDKLQFQPARDAKYTSIDCALKELKAAMFPMKMGFVGNEQYEPEAK